MKILLTGRNGQLGWELARTLAPLGELVACDRAMLDLAKPDQIAAAIRSVKPDIIVNAAAYTAVDRAESEPDIARAINAVASGVLAEEAKKLGALLVHYSTDYVFDGTKHGAYTEDDAPSPLNVYGRTKLEGECAIQAASCRHLILRTSWVYSPRGKNFPLTILRLAKERDELRVVDDQIGAPTSSDMIAGATAQILAKNMTPEGLYHLTADGSVSWCGFARAIARRANLAVRVTAVSSSEYPTPAQRPANSRLDCSQLQTAYGLHLERWEAGLGRILGVIPA
jgi:dTDP-4-dehydrorhamnose reductase